MAVFEYTDIDGDRLEFGPPPEDWDDVHQGSMAFTVTRKWSEGGNNCSFPREALERLYNAIGEHLYPSTQRPSQSELTVALNRVADALTGAATAIVPLYRAPQAVAQTTEGVPLCVRPGCTRFDGVHLEHDYIRDANGERVADTLDDPEPQFPLTSCHRNGNHGRDGLCSNCVVDPEPQAVGHPQEPETRAIPCNETLKPGQFLADVHSECGYVWAMHPVPVTNWSDALFGKPDYAAPGLHFDYCTGCGHGWNVHEECGCVAQLGKSYCECTRTRGESAP